MEFSSLFGVSKMIDQGLVAYMPNPNSFTGEDVVEIFCHGNPIIVELLIDRCVELGARLARAGEFSRRAVLNNKLSLLQAEALNKLIHCRSVEGIKWANQGLQGEIDKGLAPVEELLLDICAELEARLDYPQEGLGYVEDLELCQKLQKIASDCRQSAQTWRAGKIRLNGAQVAILGPVNAGKSSLFNHLVGKQRALVSNIPGTTRDVIEKSILIDGLEICFLDTAGARTDTQDPLEKKGIQLGIEMAKEVDLGLLLLPLHSPAAETITYLKEQLAGIDTITVGTHLDKVENNSIRTDINISNHTGEGIDQLKKIIRNKMGEISTNAEKWIVLSQRQHELLLSISSHCERAGNALQGDFGPAIAAEEVTQALERMAELSGKDAREAILDRLFSTFCIGK